MTKMVQSSKEEITDGDRKTIKESTVERTPWIESLPSYTAIGGILIAAVTAWVSFANYSSQYKKDVDTRALAAKKPFLDKQMEFYVDAVETASKIATDDVASGEDISHFWKIYWGRLGSVEDS